MAAGLLAGCTKVSHNGQLDGMWQVMELYDSDEEVKIPEGLVCYYNFYLHTCQLGTLDGRIPGLVGNLAVADDEVAMQFPYVKEGEVDKIWIGRLRYWGLPESGEAVFHVEKLNSKTMTLARGNVRVICRRF